ncbi:hypothetical protein NC651_009327 [Populus alba x Populus x berolinensis]|nr:hypothetical protein NC651_009327 [Populus alba x Populus x berolinensis]
MPSFINLLSSLSEKSHIDKQCSLANESCYKFTCPLLYKLRSRAVDTKRTILSPFTKEYRVFAANHGIR